MTRPLNANYGIIRAVSHDKSVITIRTPRGGTFKCKNEGFEVGQEVCFVLDTLNRRVIKVLPKNIADIQVLIGSMPLIQEAAQKPTNMEEEEEYEPINEYIYHDSNGPTDEEYLDIISSIHREDDREPDSTDWPEY
jgi:hypothetical protein